MLGRSLSDRCGETIARKTVLAYLGLCAVVLIWGLSPILVKRLYGSYSPTLRLTVSFAVMIPIYLILSRKRLRELDRSYLRIGIPTGLTLALAELMQKIGLQYTTPAKMSFLENLSCVTVPLFVWLLIRKKPTTVAFFSAGLCLVGAFVLNGFSIGERMTWGIGELLCAGAGLCYGFNIAVTGLYAKKFFTPLYLLVQFVVQFIVSFCSMLVLDRISIEPIRYSFKPELLLFLVSVSLVSFGLGHLIRTNCMKYVDPNRVSVIMPFSSVLTSVFSVWIGTDLASPRVVVGGLLCVLAILLPSLTDRRATDKETK